MDIMTLLPYLAYVCFIGIAAFEILCGRETRDYYAGDRLRSDTLALRAAELIFLVPIVPLVGKYDWWRLALAAAAIMLLAASTLRMFHYVRDSHERPRARITEMMRQKVQHSHKKQLRIDDSLAILTLASVIAAGIL